MATKQKILIVDDDNNIAELVALYLTKECFETKIVNDGEEALKQFHIFHPDLILLDLMLPGIDGYQVCREIRHTSDVPIIMLTARDDVEDKVNGLDLGADDYMTKPFAIQELLARVRNALRKPRADGREVSPEGEKLQVRDLVMYPSRYEVRVGNEEVQLTKKEYSLLEYLLRNKRNVLTRDQILQEVWGYDYTGDTNVVDVYIRYLRAKIDDHFGKKYIYTIRGVGYAIKD